MQRIYELKIEMEVNKVLKQENNKKRFASRENFSAILSR